MVATTQDFEVNLMAEEFHFWQTMARWQLGTFLNFEKVRAGRI